MAAAAILLAGASRAPAQYDYDDNYDLGYDGYYYDDGLYDDDWYYDYYDYDFGEEGLSEWEYEPDEGYHREEWYDPSDWFDTGVGVSYEDMDDAYDDYDYDYNNGGWFDF
jgi:hypothetical protein